MLSGAGLAQPHRQKGEVPRCAYVHVHGAQGGRVHEGDGVGDSRAQHHRPDATIGRHKLGRQADEIILQEDGLSAEVLVALASD